MREITTGLRFPEGPVAMSDGSVLWWRSRGTLTRVRSDGSKEVVAKTGGRPNDAALGPDGKVYICNNGGLKMTADGIRLKACLMDIPAGVSSASIRRAEKWRSSTRNVTDGCCVGLVTLSSTQRVDWFTDFGKVQERQKYRTAIYYAKPDGSLIK